MKKFIKDQKDLPSRITEPFKELGDCITNHDFDIKNFIDYIPGMAIVLFKDYYMLFQ